MIEWTGNQFKVGDISFQAIGDLDDLYRLSIADGYVIGKTRSYIDRYFDCLGGGDFQNVVELGIFRGGSTIFLNELLTPRRLAAVDISRKVPRMLQQYMTDNPRALPVKPFMGVNQSSVSDLEKICNDFIEGEPLDLVIDDASHFYDETRASFEFLFPRLREGGLYIIEDWGWRNHSSDNGSYSTSYGDRKSLANLVFQLVLAANTAPDLIADIHINRDFMTIRKGSKVVSDNFNVGRFCYHRGKRLDDVDFFT
ncbi:MAG: class I SAM-dependent methyltransferase [Rubellimicrobium sp.]|nr:class I SAM-dependent methyltransferase [Rubellimicrobium sp.]